MASQHSPSLTAKDMEKVVHKLGYFFIRQKGSHRQYINQYGLILTISFHSGRTISAGMMSKYLRDLKITKSEFLKLHYDT
ncbi:MAG: type II toxin-antitoxin system HicA family toxin [Patescibacteria group bacterium]